MKTRPFTLAGLAVDRVLANHSLSSTASQGRSNIPLSFFPALGITPPGQEQPPRPGPPPRWTSSPYPSLWPLVLTISSPGPSSRPSPTLLSGPLLGSGAGLVSHLTIWALRSTSRSHIGPLGGAADLRVPLDLRPQGGGSGRKVRIRGRCIVRTRGYRWI